MWIKPFSLYIFCILPSLFFWKFRMKGKNFCFAFLNHPNLVQGNFDLTTSY